MKKTYSKPQIVFDDFELSTSIAGGCEVKTNFAPMECSVELGKFVLFTEEVDMCRDVEADGSRGICYHVPMPSMTLFSS